MADTSGKGLIAFSAAEAAIEPYRAGGIIDRAIGVPERTMDGVIRDHVAAVAMFNARGDTEQERPSYVFNPAARLLINYAQRRHPNPDRTGLFADVVELDERGKPRHRVGVANPFVGETGFIRVAVGENNHGFAPSSVPLDFESDDPATMVPPNIEMADLLVMLQSKPIAEGMMLSDFLIRQQAAQNELRGRAQDRHGENYLDTEQAMTPKTDASLHLIVTDRTDSSALEAASREVGIWPIVLSVQQVIAAGRAMQEAKSKRESVLRQFATFVGIDPELADIRRALTDSVPAFVTIDFEDDRYLPSIEEKRRHGKTVDLTVKDQEAWSIADRFLLGGQGSEGPLRTQPVFSKLINYRYPQEPGQEVRKKAHGHYQLGLDPSVPENLKTYTDWLRKARLDFALTLYLRGLSQL